MALGGIGDGQESNLFGLSRVSKQNENTFCEGEGGRFVSEKGKGGKREGCLPYQENRSDLRHAGEGFGPSRKDGF